MAYLLSVFLAGLNLGYYNLAMVAASLTADAGRGMRPGTPRHRIAITHPSFAGDIAYIVVGVSLVIGTGGTATGKGMS